LNQRGVEAVYGPGASVNNATNLAEPFWFEEASTTAVAKIDHPNVADFLATTGTNMLEALVALVALYFVLKVLRTVRDGDPFVHANARRLWTAGVVLMAGGGLTSLISQVSTMVALGRLGDYTTMESSFDLTPVLCGLVLVVLGEVFRQGIKLRADTEGLV